MKTDYTIDELRNMTVKELRILSGKLNREARTRAKRLRKHGYVGSMANPKLLPVRGLRKNELISSILDRSQSYLRDSRSTISGMKRFEKNLTETLKKEYGVRIPKKRLSDFADFLDDVRSLWGALKYPSKFALQMYEEMTKAGLSNEDLGSSFDAWKKTETGMYDMLDALRDLNKDRKKISSKELLGKLMK